MKVSYKSAWLLLVPFMSLASCGGSSSATASGSPKVLIRWPALSRDINAPQYGKSVKISFLSVTTLGEAIVWTGDRPAGDGEAIVAYPYPFQRISGEGQLTVEFTALAGGNGGTLASARVPVSVQADGTVLNAQGSPLGEITPDVNVGQIIIESGNVEIGKTDSVWISGRSNVENFAILAIPTDRLQLSVTEGADNVETQATSMRGLKEGDFVLRASLKGTDLTATKTMSVVPTAREGKFFQSSPRAMVGDFQSQRLLGLFGQPFEFGPKYLSSINASTGVSTPLKSFSTDLDQLASSADGNFLWIGRPNDYSVTRLNVSTLEVSDDVRLGVTLGTTSGSVEYVASATDIAVNPNNSREIAIVPNFQSGLISGPLIARDGVLLPLRASESCESIVYTDATTLIGNTGGSTPLLAKFTVGEAGVSTTTTLPNIFDQFDRKLVVKGSRVLTSGGTVLDKSSLMVLSRVKVGNVDGGRPSLIAVDPNSDKVWYGFPMNTRYRISPSGIAANADGIVIRCYRASDLTLIESATYKFPAPAYTPTSMVRFGAKGLAMNLYPGLFVIENAPGL